MQVGLIGLGKMGINLGKNLIDHNYEVAAFDLNVNAVEEISKYGAIETSSFKELIKILDGPRIIWIMVPHAVVDSVINEITPYLSKGDIIIEAGNSHYKDSIRRYGQLKQVGVSFMDVGTSGEWKERVTELVTWSAGIQKFGVWLNPYFETQRLKKDIYMLVQQAAVIS